MRSYNRWYQFWASTVWRRLWELVSLIVILFLTSRSTVTQTLISVLSTMEGSGEQNVFTTPTRKGKKKKYAKLEEVIDRMNAQIDNLSTAQKKHDETLVEMRKIQAQLEKEQSLRIEDA